MNGNSPSRSILSVELLRNPLLILQAAGEESHGSRPARNDVKIDKLFQQQQQSPPLLLIFDSDTDNFIDFCFFLYEFALKSYHNREITRNSRSALFFFNY